MLALKETVKMQHYDYTSTLLYLLWQSLLINEISGGQRSVALSYTFSYASTKTIEGLFNLGISYAKDQVTTWKHCTSQCRLELHTEIYVLR